MQGQPQSIYKGHRSNQLFTGRLFICGRAIIIKKKWTVIRNQESQAGPKMLRIWKIHLE